MLADNTFEQGEIVNANANSSPRIKGVHEFNERCAKDSRLRATILPTSDGLTFAGPVQSLVGVLMGAVYEINSKSVVEDVLRIRHHPLVPNDIPIYDYIYEVKSGRLVEVPDTMTAGKTSQPRTILEAVVDHVEC